MRLFPVISLMMNSQESSATGYSPHELFLGRPAWFLHAPYPEDTHSSVGEWIQEQQAKVHKAKAMLQRVRERRGIRRTSTEYRPPTKRGTGCWCTTVDYLPGHALPAMTHTPGRTRFYQWMDTVSPCGVHPIFGGTLVCAAQHLKRYYDPEDLCGEEWELNDEGIAALDLQGAASPMEVEGELPDMNARRWLRRASTW